MAGTKHNRRTLYTKAAIKEAFLTLLSAKTLSKITVTEICKRADINRGTFYQYYTDPYALYHELEDEIIAELKPILRKTTSTEIEQWLHSFINILLQQKVMMQHILADYPNSRVIQVIFDQVHDFAITQFSERFKETDQRLLEYYFTYFVSGTIGTLLQWLSDGKQTTTAEITRVLAALFEMTPH
ncbi:TetR/AcrR family transcriptional regulator [Lactobacillus sp. CC-MHH1034]|uniref:TetR/AcrR family transcriptional regulator n=1 Tax=Agrilactobacillus fermenti TaxID=2586909 RepID=UPI001E4F31A0|nr:TetR/AcrR family transcriptional regulator [Agrilactobacillus fermenti]MCD2256508.1 TetR/AcrR family transcriptional regulator [Agrilactobacillus fermenti]